MTQSRSEMNVKRLTENTVTRIRVTPAAWRLPRSRLFVTRYFSHEPAQAGPLNHARDTREDRVACTAWFGALIA